MEKIKFLQQGDVLIKRIDILPKQLKNKFDARGFVFAEGEATGHYHAVKNNDKCQLLVDKNGKMYFKNEIPVEIQHQEHHTIEIPSGIWEIEKVREYDHFSEEIREVID